MRRSKSMCLWALKTQVSSTRALVSQYSRDGLYMDRRALVLPSHGGKLAAHNLELDNTAHLQITLMNAT